MLSMNGAAGVRDGARLATGLAVVVLAAGLAMLLAYSVIEAVANPGYSVVDGYWRGQLPWMGIIEGLVVAGATSGVLAGAAAVLLFGSWSRRVIMVPPLSLAALWWLAAWAGAGIGGGACVACAPLAPDPWAYAYSAPVLALQMLILPAVGTATLALTLRGGASSSSPG